MIRNSVVLPQPDGPTSAPTSPFASVSDRPSSTSRRPPVAAWKNFCLIATSSRLGPTRFGSSGPGTPTGDMSFKRLHQEGFDHQHDCAEGERISQDLGDIEQLERDPDL